LLVCACGAVMLLVWGAGCACRTPNGPEESVLPSKPYAREDALPAVTPGALADNPGVKKTPKNPGTPEINVHDNYEFNSEQIE